MTSTAIYSPTTPVPSSSSPFFHLVLFPLVLIDLTVHMLLFIYTMVFQAILYGIYIGLFIVCTSTGQYHKLEKPGDIPQTRSEVRTQKKKQRLQRKQIRNKKTSKSAESHNDSGYNTDIDLK